MHLMWIAAGVAVALAILVVWFGIFLYKRHRVKEPVTTTTASASFGNKLAQSAPQYIDYMSENALPTDPAPPLLPQTIGKNIHDKLQIQQLAR